MRLYEIAFFAAWIAGVLWYIYRVIDNKFPIVEIRYVEIPPRRYRDDVPKFIAEIARLIEIELEFLLNMPSMEFCALCHDWSEIHQFSMKSVPYEVQIRMASKWPGFYEAALQNVISADTWSENNWRNTEFWNKD